MARQRQTKTVTARKPGVMDRLRSRPPPGGAKVTHKESTNPLTGKHTTTTTRETHPRGAGQHGRAGREPVAWERPAARRTHQQRRKPGIGDKLSGAMMRLKGTVSGKPGVKAAGTRRAHGTDGRRRR